MSKKNPSSTNISQPYISTTPPSISTSPATSISPPTFTSDNNSSPIKSSSSTGSYSSTLTFKIKKFLLKKILFLTTKKRIILNIILLFLYIIELSIFIKIFKENVTQNDKNYKFYSLLLTINVLFFFFSIINLIFAKIFYAFYDFLCLFFNAIYVGLIMSWVFIASSSPLLSKSLAGFYFLNFLLFTYLIMSEIITRSSVKFNMKTLFYSHINDNCYTFPPVEDDNDEKKSKKKLINNNLENDDNENDIDNEIDSDENDEIEEVYNFNKSKNFLTKIKNNTKNLMKSKNKQKSSKSSTSNSTSNNVSSSLNSAKKLKDSHLTSTNSMKTSTKKFYQNYQKNLNSTSSISLSASSSISYDRLKNNNFDEEIDLKDGRVEDDDDYSESDDSDSISYRSPNSSGFNPKDQFSSTSFSVSSSIPNSTYGNNSVSISLSSVSSSTLASDRPNGTSIQQTGSSSSSSSSSSSGNKLRPGVPRSSSNYSDESSISTSNYSDIRNFDDPSVITFLNQNKPYKDEEMLNKHRDSMLKKDKSKWLEEEDERPNEGIPLPPSNIEKMKRLSSNNSMKNYFDQASGIINSSTVTSSSAASIIPTANPHSSSSKINHCTSDGQPYLVFDCDLDASGVVLQDGFRVNLSKLDWDNCHMVYPYEEEPYDFDDKDEDIEEGKNYEKIRLKEIKNDRKLLRSLDKKQNYKKIKQIPTDLDWKMFEYVTHITDSSSCHIFSAYWNNTPVILKLIKEERLTSTMAVAEFETEENVLMRLNHPHIISLLGSGKLQSVLPNKQVVPRKFLVLELLGGGSLSHTLGLRNNSNSPLQNMIKNNNDNLKKNFLNSSLFSITSGQNSSNSLPFLNLYSKKISFLNSLRIALALSEALQYLHLDWSSSIQIIHRDLKPDNIGWTSDGVLKLFDFGLSTSIRKNKDKSECYKLTGNTGTLRYMAPEVILNRNYNTSVDTYSFGILLWQITTGEVPFNDIKTKKNFIERVVLNGERLKMSSDWPIEFSVLLNNCWSENIKDRPNFNEITLKLKNLIDKNEKFLIQKYKKLKNFVFRLLFYFFCNFLRFFGISLLIFAFFLQFFFISYDNLIRLSCLNFFIFFFFYIFFISLFFLDTIHLYFVLYYYYFTSPSNVFSFYSVDTSSTSPTSSSFLYNSKKGRKNKKKNKDKDEESDLNLTYLEEAQGELNLYSYSHRLNGSCSGTDRYTFDDIIYLSLLYQQKLKEKEENLSSIYHEISYLTSISSSFTSPTTDFTLNSLVSSLSPSDRFFYQIEKKCYKDNDKILWVQLALYACCYSPASSSSSPSSLFFSNQKNSTFYTSSLTTASSTSYPPSNNMSVNSSMILNNERIDDDVESQRNRDSIRNEDYFMKTSISSVSISSNISNSTSSRYPTGTPITPPRHPSIPSNKQSIRTSSASSSSSSSLPVPPPISTNAAYTSTSDFNYYPELYNNDVNQSSSLFQYYMMNNMNKLPSSPLSAASSTIPTTSSAASSNLSSASNSPKNSGVTGSQVNVSKPPPPPPPFLKR